jgi:hypothetical protein
LKIIIDGPIFLTPPKNVTVAENESAHLVCAVQKNPMPTLLWQIPNKNKTIDGEKFEEDNDKQTSILKFSRVTREDSGTYRCTVLGHSDFINVYVLIVTCNHS